MDVIFFYNIFIKSLGQSVHRWFVIPTDEIHKLDTKYCFYVYLYSDCKTQKSIFIKVK